MISGIRLIDIFVWGLKSKMEIDKELLEELAKNVHDQWSRGRIAEGWTYGPERNDALKQTPCLVPYEQLPEIEKEYDRNTALQTIKFLLEKGYKITK